MPDTTLIQKLLCISNVSYTCGTGARRRNFFGLAINMLLVHKNLRPAFMFQSIDYSESEREKAVSILLALHREFPVGTFHIFSCSQGVIFSNSDITRQINMFNETQSSFILGNILGYPCSCDLDDISVEKFFCHILLPGGGEILSNIARTSRDVRRFRRMYKVFNAFVKEHIGFHLILRIDKNIME